MNAVLLSPDYTFELLGGALKNLGAQPTSLSNLIRVCDMGSQ